MTKLVKEMDGGDKAKLKKKMKKTKLKLKKAMKNLDDVSTDSTNVEIKIKKEAKSIAEDAQGKDKLKKKKLDDMSTDSTNVGIKMKKEKKEKGIAEDAQGKNKLKKNAALGVKVQKSKNAAEDIDLLLKVKKKKEKSKAKVKRIDTEEVIEDMDVTNDETHDKDEPQKPLQQRLVSMSADTALKLKGDEDNKKDQFQTTIQKERLEKRKQRRKIKREKAKAKEQKKKQDTEGALWKKLNEVKKAPEDAATETVVENVSIEDEPDAVRKAMREKKRDKRVERKLNKKKLIEEQEALAGSAGVASIEYLHTWENDREEWKFQTVRQAWLMKKMYNMEEISDDDFEILMRYLEPTNAKVKKQLVKEAEEIIQKIEEIKENADEDDDEEVTNCKLDRARQVIQMLAV